MTKPASVFLQLLGVVLIIISLSNSSGTGAGAWTLAGVGVLCILWGGLAARRWLGKRD